MQQYIGLEFQFKDRNNLEPYRVVVEGEPGLIARLMTKQLTRVLVEVIDHVPGIGIRGVTFDASHKG